MKPRTAMNGISVSALALGVALVCGCASGGGGSSDSSGSGSPNSDPAAAPLRPGYEPSPCGTLYGYPVPCTSYLPRFPGDPEPSFVPPPPPTFSTWNDLMRGVVTQAFGLGTLLTYEANPEGNIRSVNFYTPAERAYVNMGNFVFQYDAQGRLLNLSLGGGGGDFSASTAQRVLTDLSGTGQRWLDIGYRKVVDGTPPTPFADLPARYLEILANPYVAGWNYQSFGIWNVTDPSWVAFGARTFGTVTPAAAVPTTGSATFNGKLGGLYVSPTGMGSIATADVSMNANFNARSLSFASTGTSLTRDLATATSAPHLNLSGTLTYSPGPNTFNGTLLSAGGSMSGSTKGQFYGPAAQELGGVFTLKSSSTVETFAGAYGAKR